MEAFFLKGIWMTQLLKSEIITKFPEEGTWDLFPNLRMVGDSSKITDLGTKRRIFFISTIESMTSKPSPLRWRFGDRGFPA